MEKFPNREKFTLLNCLKIFTKAFENQAYLELAIETLASLDLCRNTPNTKNHCLALGLSSIEEMKHVRS